MSSGQRKHSAAETGWTSLSLLCPHIKDGEMAVEQPFPTAFVEAVKQERKALETLLSDAGWQVRRSQGNFVFGECGDTLWWRDALAGLGVAIRAWPNDRPPSCIRVSCPGCTKIKVIRTIRTVSKPEAILFDIDGVLIDVRESYRTAILRTMQRTWPLKFLRRD